LEGDDDPNGQFAKSDSNDVEEGANDYAILDLVDHPYDSRVSILPLHVDVTRKDTHHVGRGTDPWLVVELVHELWLGGKFRIGNRIAPVINHDLDEGTQYRC
jgi:hypothetical protein